MHKRKLFKYNQDDILEILIEHLAQENGFNAFQSSAVLLGEPGKDLRLLAAIGDEDDDHIHLLNLEQVDKELNYNGSHAHLHVNNQRK